MEWGVFPENPMSKCEPYENETKKMPAAASVAVKVGSRMGKENARIWRHAFKRVFERFPAVWVLKDVCQRRMHFAL
jgi:hypothetical protein